MKPIIFQIFLPDKIFCYFGSWATYRTGAGKFDVEDIDANACTHAIFSFIGLNSDATVAILDPWNEISLNGLSRFVALKQKNPSLKVMVAMGGWNQGSTVYSSVAANPTLRTKLVSNIILFLQQYGFDGFDLDWEYPAARGGAAADKDNYVKLLKELRERFDPLGYLLTAAVGVSNAHISTSYDIPNMSRYLHFILLMAYDLHGVSDGVTGQNAPLFPSTLESPAFADFNIQAVVANWISKGASATNLVLGIPLYGRTFTLSSLSNTKLGAPISGPGTAGDYTQEEGSLSYLEVSSETI